MTELYIVRHGQTDSNIRSTYLGHTDIELNNVGKSQAQKLADKLQGVKFDALYTSPLTRAVQTAEEIIKKQSGLFMTMNYGLIERDYGVWDNLTFEEIMNRDSEKCREWLDNWVDFEIPEGESAVQVQERVSMTTDKIISQNLGNKVLIVSHLGVIRHMLSHLLGMSVADSWKFTADNCSVSTIRIDDGKVLLTGMNNKL